MRSDRSPRATLGLRIAAAAGLEAGEPLCLKHPDKRPAYAGLVVDDQAVGGARGDGLRDREAAERKGRRKLMDDVRALLPAGAAASHAESTLRNP